MQVHFIGNAVFLALARLVDDVHPVSLGSCESRKQERKCDTEHASSVQVCFLFDRLYSLQSNVIIRDKSILNISFLVT